MFPPDARKSRKRTPPPAASGAQYAHMSRKGKTAHFLLRTHDRTGLFSQPKPSILSWNQQVVLRIFPPPICLLGTAYHDFDGLSRKTAVAFSKLSARGLTSEKRPGHSTTQEVFDGLFDFPDKGGGIPQVNVIRSERQHTAPFCGKTLQGVIAVLGPGLNP